MISVKKIFDSISGNSGLTETVVYENLLSEDEKYEILSASLYEENKLGLIPKIELNNKDIIVIDQINGIQIIRKGDAGRILLLKSDRKYTLNDDTYVLITKNNDYTNKYKKLEVEFLKWFIVKHQSTVIEYSTTNDNSTWNKTNFFKDCKIELPSEKEVIEYAKHFDLRTKIIHSANAFQKQINSVLKKDFLVHTEKLELIHLYKILSYISRNDSLSEEGLYNIPKTKENNITVLSGSIENIFYGEIPLDTEKIHYLENKQGLHLITRGKAGTLTYIPKGYYATNTNAFILYLKDDIKKEIGIKTEKDEEIYLKFLKIYLEPLFLDISSNSDVSVFPLTKVFEDMEIPKFKLNTEIKNIVLKYDILINIKTKIENQKTRLELLLEKEIV
jgi:hypothetical protein